jgi:hypothetical protein
MPSAGSAYTYRVDRAAANSTPALRLTEMDTLSVQANSVFRVFRTSDTSSGFFTSSSSEHFKLLTNGDLVHGLDTLFDGTALPIGSHLSFDDTLGPIPTKKNGVEADGWLIWHTQYDGEEDLLAAGQSFSCSKVEEKVTVTASSGDPANPIATRITTHIYWYSPIIHFFVKDELVTGDSNSLTRTLVSYKLQ